jgi:16S rRNA (guanine966-N2)-methyltransferase
MLRISGGTLRGRLLKTPKGDGTRPTSDMVRQALFNLLGQDLTDARVLDVFCGTGALGIEALSRGAAHVWMVDKARAALSVTSENVQAVGMQDRVTLVSGDAEKELLKLPRGQADLALCDPPYALEGRVYLLTALARALRPGGLLVFETDGTDTLTEAKAPWVRVKERSYGSTTLHILEWPGDAPGAVSPGTG